MITLDENKLLQVNGGGHEISTANNPRHACADGTSGTLLFIGADAEGDLYQCLHCGATGHMSELNL